MGILDWIKGDKKRPSPNSASNSASHSGSASASSGMGRAPGTRGFGKTQHPPTGQPRRSAATDSGTGRDQKKNARYMRRELLYGIVRECMIRSGVLSAGYKFKALALDPRGLEFIVMVDLSTDFAGGDGRWNEIEDLITQTAKSRHGLVVKAVYWRLNDQVSAPKSTLPPGLTSVEPAASLAQAAQVGLAAGAVGTATLAAQHAAAQHLAAQQAAQHVAQQMAHQTARAATPRSGPISRPMPLFPEGPDEDTHLDTHADTHSDNLEQAADVDVDLNSGIAGRAAAAHPGQGRFEPIAADEVEAFKRALAAGAAAAPVAAAQQVSRPAAAPSKKPAMPAVPAAPAGDAANAAAGNYTLLTGFEDTEAVDPDFAPPALGTTQYGELR